MTPTNFAELKRKVIRALGDEPVEPSSSDSFLVHGAQTSAEILADGVEAALKAICNRFPRSLTIEFSESGDTFELPANFIEVDAVYDSKSMLFVPQMQFRSNVSPYGENGNLSANSWYIYPSPDAEAPEAGDPTPTFISFLSGLTVKQTVKVFFSALWDIPTEDTDVIQPPQMLTTPLTLYAASYCLLRSAAESSNIRQFATKVDSGQPTDNPLKDMSDFFLRRYESAMSSLPMRNAGAR